MNLHTYQQTRIDDGLRKASRAFQWYWLITTYDYYAVMSSFADKGKNNPKIEVTSIGQNV